MSWQYGLIRDLKNPECWIISSKFGVVLADKYPKAKHHYLVLPLANIPSIFHLDRCHLPLLNELYLLARKVVEVEAGGVPWEDFQVGFHAEPSLHRLHLHVISRDFVSPCMRTKKHWNSHTTELFVPFEKLCDQLEKEDCFSRLPKSVVENLLSKPLICNQCEFEPESLLDLKTHLFYHWHTKKKEREEQKILDKIAKMSLYNNPPLKNQAKKPRGHKPRGPRQRNGPRDPSNSASFLEKGNGFQEESSQKPNQSSVGDKVEPSAQPTESSFQSTNQQLHQNSNLQHSNQNSNQQHHAYFNKQKGQISYEQHPSTKNPQQSKFKLQQPNPNMHPNQVNPQNINQFKNQNRQNRQNNKHYNKQNGLNPYQHEMSAQNPQQTSCNQANKRSNLVHDESTNFRNFKTSNHKSKSKNKNPAIKKNHPKSADNLQKHESDVPPPPSVSKPSDTS